MPAGSGAEHWLGMRQTTRATPSMHSGHHGRHSSSDSAGKMDHGRVFLTDVSVSITMLFLTEFFFVTDKDHVPFEKSPIFRRRRTSHYKRLKVNMKLK